MERLVVTWWLRANVVKKIKGEKQGEKNIFRRKPIEKKCLYKIRLNESKGYHRYATRARV